MTPDHRSPHTPRYPPLPDDRVAIFADDEGLNCQCQHCGAMTRIGKWAALRQWFAEWREYAKEE